MRSDESNVDWGQGLKQLRVWVDRHAAGRTIRSCYFGLFPPEGYGVMHEKVEPADLASIPLPGLYVISAHALARLPTLEKGPSQGSGHWVRTRLPAAIIGHAYSVYEFP